MPTPIPDPPRISDFRSQDGWRSGLAHFGSRSILQFFVSPSGETWLYVWSAPRRRSLNGLKGRVGRVKAALHRALAARPPEASAW